MTTVIQPHGLFIDSLKDGLGVYGCLEVMRRNVSFFERLMCRNDDYTYDDVLGLLTPNYSGEIGSNQRNAEVDVFKQFVDKIEDIFKNGKLLVFLLHRVINECNLY